MPDALSELPALFDFEDGVWRGDTRVWTHVFNDAPPAWEPQTTYGLGDVEHAATEVYVPHTTCTFDDTAYTCLLAHTSGDDFDPDVWAPDQQALGPETDISDYDFLAQYRQNTRPSAVVLATDACELVTDGLDGRMQRTLTAEEAAKLTTTTFCWDLQTTHEGVVKTMLYAIDVPVLGDSSRVEA